MIWKYFSDSRETKKKNVPLITSAISVMKFGKVASDRSNSHYHDHLDYPPENSISRFVM